MHPNPAFRQTPLARNLAFARSRGFGILTLSGPDGPLAAHVPFLLSADNGHADLHLARSNPIARSSLPAPALIAISGPDAYVSPDWYGPHELLPDQVPTWNYVAVHLRGVLEPLPDDALRAHVDALSAAHEARITGKTPWTSAKMTEGAMPRMMRMILPFRLRITGVEGTWKLNQNKPADVRSRAAEALSRRDPGAQAIAALIRALPEG
jgi:transcriptional regulator